MLVLGPARMSPLPGVGEAVGTAIDKMFERASAEISATARATTEFIETEQVDRGQDIAETAAAAQETSATASMKRAGTEERALEFNMEQWNTQAGTRKMATLGASKRFADDLLALGVAPSVIESGLPEGMTIDSLTGLYDQYDGELKAELTELEQLAQAEEKRVKEGTGSRERLKNLREGLEAKRRTRDIEVDQKLEHAKYKETYGAGVSAIQDASDRFMKALGGAKGFFADPFTWLLSEPRGTRQVPEAQARKEAAQAAAARAPGMLPPKPEGRF
jgi:hypothetical protein